MNRSTLRVTLIAFLAVLLMPQVAAAQPGTNTSSTLAMRLGVGQISSYTTFNSNTPERWYHYRVRAGRSYCVEVVMAYFEDTDSGFDDPSATVFQNDATTPIVSNDDSNVEPSLFLGSRACYIPDATQAATSNFLKITRHSSSQTLETSYSLRVVETTLFSNWFFLGSDYSAYTLLRNTTDTTVAYTMNWRNAAGIVVATTSGSLMANASIFTNARDFAGALAAVSGTVELAHNSSPGAIVASTTVLSATTGLSFDAPFVARNPW